MYGRKNPISDRDLNQKVSQSLSSHGMRPPCKVAVTSMKGTVTLSGQIQYEHQRQLAKQTARNVDGVDRIVDQLQVIVRQVGPKIHHKM